MSDDSAGSGRKSSDRDHQRYSLSIYLLLLCVGVLLLLVHNLIVGKFPQSHDEVLVLLLREAGFALLVAVILIFSIERLTRERHQREVNLWIAEASVNVFRAVMARNTPPSVFLEVEKNLLYRDYYRTDTAVTYSLRRLDTSGLPAQVGNTGIAGFRQFEVAFHYTVRNINQANRTIIYPLRLSFDLPKEKELRDKCQLTLVEVNGKSVPVTDANCKRTAEFFVFEESIPVNRGESIRVKCCWVQIAKEEGQEIWSSIDPTDGVTFTVITPEGDLKVVGDSMHSEPLEVISQNEYAVTWRLAHGIFPFQGIYFRWEKR